MAEKIKCKACGKDSGYTTETPTEDKERSFIPSMEPESHRFHFCSSCWILYSGDKLQK